MFSDIYNQQKLQGGERTCREVERSPCSVILWAHSLMWMLRKGMTPRAYVNATLIGSSVTENIMSMGSSYSSNHLLAMRDLGDYNVEITAQFGTIILFFPSSVCWWMDPFICFHWLLSYSELFSGCIPDCRPNRDEALVINKVDTDGVGYSSCFQKRFIQFYFFYCF